MVIPYRPSKNWILYWKKIIFHCSKTLRFTSRPDLATSKQFWSFQPLVNECCSVEHNGCCVSVVKARYSAMGWLLGNSSTLKKSLSLNLQGFGVDTLYLRVIKWFYTRNQFIIWWGPQSVPLKYLLSFFFTSCDKLNNQGHFLNILKSEVLSWGHSHINCALWLLHFDFVS